MSKTFYRKPREKSHVSRGRRRKRYEKKMGLGNGVLIGWDPSLRFHRYIKEG